MRPLRLLLSLASCVLAVSLFLYIALPADDPRLSDHPTASHKKKSKLRALFSFSAPSLFPPSAIISLTDDNSTFFLARPAAFGPPLPSRGLSGPLWTGSGFGGDTLSHGGLAAGADGELGCSDVPGWDERRGRGGSGPQLDTSSRKSVKATANDSPASKPARLRRGPFSGKPGTVSASKSESKALEDDGTDDHYHDTSTDTWLPTSKSQSLSKPASEHSDHADIQSLQESAEIAGKVVLLRRGGCGFLEKVKWAQRRGGVAVIVGDDIRGGPLVTMYARGDTSNITIPALFTSHTTAHLLSSLVPFGGIIENLPTEDTLKLGLSKASKPSKGSTTRAAHKKPSKGSSSDDGDVHVDAVSGDKPGWIRSLLAFFGAASNKDPTAEESRRPPSSGNIDWILVEDWEDEEPTKTRAATQKTKIASSSSPTKSSDDFVIGVQDWRDPDLLPPKSESSTSKQTKAQSTGKQSSSETSPAGGNAVPGSGEYAELGLANGKSKSASSVKSESPKEQDSGKNRGWLSNMSWNRHSRPKPKVASPISSTKPKASVKSTPTSTRVATESQNSALRTDSDRHDGLWVTLTPTSMSNSPFFDTLLVLVVSPLVTLTVVYALLLLRSRIRRRRWRAPKSVTLNSGDSSASTSPIATPAAGSPRTPLLQSSSSASTSAPRSRPRSRTAGDMPSGSLGRSTSPEEKNETGLAAWRRKYGGRQRECVVCLEEYVDGVSRVMSLPCGHEFHAECITPWLTTRRRTCPICKGDVVRSLASSSQAHASSSYSSTNSHSPSPFRGSTRPLLGARPSSEDEDEDFQDETAQTRNDSPSAARPISISSMESLDDHDLEGGRRHDDDGGIVSWAREGLHDLQSWAGSFWSSRTSRGRSAERFDDEGFDRSR
ncbi:PA domain-containing protein [Macrophomina phaseolina]|uniref:RING-type E3 ubiquitin transferase n=1 Tax=Macrophomina phaseolina TaxID=35725 RepID=A0ABQ8GIT2_9PEZI|nr:PA domain-containing protein [Macrophomina phaseolina]